MYSKLRSLVVLVVIMLSLCPVNLRAEAMHFEVILDVQRDGTVIVTHVVNVTEPCVYFEVEALAKPLEPVLAVGREIYDTSVKPVNGTYVIRVYAPDAGLVNVTYVTDALVRKELPNLWIMNFSCRYVARVILPVNSIPVKMPENFTDLYESDGRYVVLLPPGEHEIMWVLKVKLPVLIPKAEVLKVEAPEEVNSNDKLTVIVIVRNSGNASSTIFIKIIDKLRNETVFYDTIFLDPEHNETFKVELSAPQVNEVKTWELLIECGHENIVDDIIMLKVRVIPRPQGHYLLIVAVIGVVALGVILSFLFSRKHEYEELKRILTEVDIEIIKFLKSKGGKALQKEIVTSLGLPKTTVHRHLKKLQKYGIIEIKRLGATNVVRLVKKLKV